MTDALTGGSKWRRWEPHVHLPGTLFNDQFGSTTIEQALDALAECNPAIEVVGVTDYFTTASFRRAEAAWKGGAGSSIRCLFPNVELRLNDATARGSGVNLHILAAPEDADLLDSLLGRLTFTYQEVEFAATDGGLTDLGRAFRNNALLEEAAARSEGANQFKVSFEQLKTLFQRDARFRERCLVGVAAGSNDGSSGMKAADGGFAAYRQSLERFAHIMFSGNENERDFWLGRGVDDQTKIERVYNGLKLCLHGSDAHEFAELGKPDQDRYSWLKGDPCFDTLWHACLAPERRANIASTTPAAGQHGRIEAVTINDNSWFTVGTVPVNTGLVAIIGPRGSGKTALADLIAVGAGSVQPFENEASFVSRAGNLLAGSQATVSWYQDAATTHGLVPDETPVSGPRRVRYLSQQFVERLCASDGVTSELLFEIERVIFEAWPVEQRQGATSFQELLNIRLGAVRSAQRDELTAVTEISESITDQRVLQRGLAKKEEQRSTTASTVNSVEGQISELTGKADAASGERHGTVSTALADRQGDLQSVDRRVTDLKALQAEVQAARTSHFPAFLRQRVQTPHPHAGLTDEQWSAFLPQFSGDVDRILSDVLIVVGSEHASIAGLPVDREKPPELDSATAEDVRLKTVAELTFEQARLEKLVGLDKQRSAKLTQLQGQLSVARAAVAKLDTETAEAKHAEARILELISERTQRYSSYFNALLTEEQELRALYAPLDTLLQAFGASVAKLKLSVRRRVNLAPWVKQGEDLIDLRTAGPFRGTGGIRPIAETFLLSAWESGDGDQAAAAIQQFSQDHSGSLRAHSPVATQGDEKAYREWERGIARWLYNVGHIDVTYSLEYEGLNVERLSPGSRGIVLLLLYLAVDQSETDPLMIDQPEENLDPKSVYSELVALFQSASERRQIIMVTHNANLVVNTDVDQVIVASCDSLEEGRLPKLSYQAGGLENPGIRQAVCEVLEGGAEAFRQRARRLHIDAPSSQPIDE